MNRDVYVPEADRHDGAHRKDKGGNKHLPPATVACDGEWKEGNEKKGAEPGKPHDAALRGGEIGRRRRWVAGTGAIAASQIEGRIESGEVKATGPSCIGNLDRDVGTALGDKVPENLEGLAQVIIRSSVDCADPDIIRRYGGFRVEKRKLGSFWFDEMNAIEGELYWDILNCDGASGCQELTDLRLERGPLLGREHGIRGDAKIAPLLQGEGAYQELFLYLPGIEIERSAQLGRRREGVLSRNVGSECECECETGPEPTRGKVEA